MMGSDQQSNSADVTLPPAPREPDLDECCGSGCDPCVFDLYEQRLERWRERCEALKKAASRQQREHRS